jgi:hypothetical protein
MGTAGKSLPAGKVQGTAELLAVWTNGPAYTGDRQVSSDIGGMGQLRKENFVSGFISDRRKPKCEMDTRLQSGE